MPGIGRFFNDDGLAWDVDGLPFRKGFVQHVPQFLHLFWRQAEDLLPDLDFDSLDLDLISHDFLSLD